MLLVPSHPTLRIKDVSLSPALISICCDAMYFPHIGRNAVKPVSPYADTI